MKKRENKTEYSRAIVKKRTMEKEKNTNKNNQRLRNFQSYMNTKAFGNAAYIPTEVEHIANVLSHGFCVIPAFAGLLHMLRLPGLTALIYRGGGKEKKKTLNFRNFVESAKNEGYDPTNQNCISKNFELAVLIWMNLDEIWYGL